MKFYFVSLRIQSEYGKIWIRKNSVFGHISHSKMPVHLVGNEKRTLYLEQPTILLARKYLNTMLLTSLLNIFQGTDDFVILTDSVIICIYLGATVSFSKNPPTYVLATRATSVITPQNY